MKNGQIVNRERNHREEKKVVAVPFKPTQPHKRRCASNKIPQEKAPASAGRKMRLTNIESEEVAEPVAIKSDGRKAEKAPRNYGLQKNSKGTKGRPRPLILPGDGSTEEEPKVQQVRQTTQVHQVPQLPAALVFSPRNYLLTIGAQKGKKRLLQMMNQSPKSCVLCRHANEFRRITAENLKSKYMATREAYYIKTINDIVFNENSHLVAIFKDYLIYDDSSEFLRNYNTKLESFNQIGVLCKFYHSYSKVFPNYFMLPENRYMYKNIRRKQKAIDKRQEMEAEIEDEKNRSKKGDSTNERILTSNLRSESSLTLTMFKPEELNKVVHNVNFETLMQSYIKAQAAGPNESLGMSRSIQDLPLPELLEKFMRKDSVVVEKRPAAQFQTNKFVTPNSVSKRPEIKINRKGLQNIEVLVGAKKVVMEEAPLWTQIKDNLKKYKRSRSAVRTKNREPAASTREKRASSNPRAAMRGELPMRASEREEITLTKALTSARAMKESGGGTLSCNTLKPNGDKKLKLEESKDLDLFRANKQILEVIQRHQCSSTGVIKNNLAQSSARRKKQKKQQGGNELVKSSSRQASAHASPSPKKITDLLTDKRTEKRKRQITNMLQEHILKERITNTEKTPVKVDTQPKATPGHPKINLVINANAPGLQRRPRNLSSDKKPVLDRQKVLTIGRTSSVKSTREKRLFSGGSIGTTSSTKGGSSGSGKQFGQGRPGILLNTKANQDPQKKVLAIDIDSLYRNLKKQRIEVNVNAVLTDKARRKETEHGRSVTPDCSKKYRSEYLNTLREQMELRKKDIFILASKGAPKRPTNELLTTATTKDKTIRHTNTMSTFDKCGTKPTAISRRNKSGAFNPKIGNLFSKDQMYTHI